MMVMGKGNIRLQVNDLTQVITSVYFLPELKNNLLSVGQLQERGLAILIKTGLCKVFHPRRGLTMQSRMSANRMFIVLASVMPQTTTCFQTVTEDTAQLWHCRFGHLCFKVLRTLSYNNMVQRLPKLMTPSRVCSDCMVGKQTPRSYSQEKSVESFQASSAYSC